MNQSLPRIDQLIEAFAKLPGIGKKTAQRLAFHLLGRPAEEAMHLADAIAKARQSIHLCPQCCHLTDADICDICANPSRDHTVICVVESPLDVLALERTHEFQGLYHVLHGAMSPMSNIGPDDLHLKELLTRLRDHHDIQEIILANNATVEGEATATYIARLLAPVGLKITRLAQGLPMGSNLEYADEVTLARAIEGRHLIG